MMTRKNSAFATLIVAGLLASLGCEVARDASQEVVQKATAVQLAVVQQAEVDRTTTQPATVHAYFETEIHAKVSGYANMLAADIGDVVEAGSVLAKLDIPELEKQQEVLAAQVQLLASREVGAASGVRLAEAGLASAVAQFEQAKSELLGAEASLAAAEAENARTQDLVSRGSLQQRVLDEVTKRRDSAAAQYAAVESSVMSVEAEVQVAKAQLATMKAAEAVAKVETEVAKRELEESQVMLGYSKITAPMAGVISQRNIEFGELVRGESQDRPLFVVSQVDRLRVRTFVPENDAPFVQPGDKVDLRFPSFDAEEPLKATVTRRAGSLDPSTRTMIVEAEIENVDGKMLPGMFGKATIQLQTSVVANLLPARAVRFDDSGRSYVYVVDKDNKVRIADVKTGLDTGKHIEIIAGLSAGDRVIGAHLKRFIDGQAVRPIP